ncbi:GGDEF domain-containing protein [Actinoplanes couchii]|uniref:GGDEF domain-containing protein n=1 Tax=Actinoplanes couchii TaxID=403638 RepID=UPI0023B242F5|nr:diguanylate cyclase [Actinoplanes couchii]MDR6322177.1 GGDEF domain-containing protein [Actinoplanes couchii]
MLRGEKQQTLKARAGPPMVHVVERGTPRAGRESRRQSLRASAVYGAVPGVLSAAYAISTCRLLLLVVSAALIGFALFGWATAGLVARTRWWIWIQLAGAAVNLAGAAALALLDSGLGGPLGSFIPLTVVLMAIVVPPRAFVLVSGLGLASYAVVWIWGDPAPPGYALVHALGYGCVAVLCLRHSSVLASLRRRLASSSRTDPLTGCLNRRGFDDRVAAVLADGNPATLVLLDLDRFKEVNDTYGHRAGDDLLAWVGQELRADDSSVAGRLGGDEFAVLLTGPDTAQRVERLRRCAPLSLGRAEFPADATDLTALTRIADERLYQDKFARVRRTPTAETVAAAREGVCRTAADEVEAGERRRHSIADPGWMSMTQTCVALVYVVLPAADHPHRFGLIALSVWGFLTGLAVVAGAGWLSRSRAARPLMLAFAGSAFVSCAAVATLDGGVDHALGVGMLLSIPLLMLGMRPVVAAPVALVAGALYLLVGLRVGDATGWYVAIHLLGTAAVAWACAMQGRAAARQRRMLTRLARVDVLTGVLNRRGFTELFTRTPKSLMVLDLNGFKQLNDTHGHAAGDELLTWVATTLASYGEVGRLGGDEFVVLTADPDPEGIREALAARTGVSVGVAAPGVDGDDFDSLYAVADARLYQEKPVRTRV